MGTEITISRLGRHFFCRETTHMPPSGRQLMSICASEHRAFVRAKARFAGQRAQEHSFVRRNAVFTGHIAMYRWRHFLAESAARALSFPTSQRPTCPLPTRRPAGHLRPASSLNPRRTTARCLWPGLPQRIPSDSVKDPSARRRSGRGWHDRQSLAGWVGHEHTA